MPGLLHLKLNLFLDDTELQILYKLFDFLAIMILLEKTLFFIGIISYLVVHARAVGETKENSYFREYRPGRLFSVGIKKYVSFYTHKGHTYVDTDKSTELSARLYARVITDGSTPYGIITSGEEHDLLKCKIKHSSFSSGKAKQFKGCPSLSVISEKRSIVGLKKFNKESSFRFSFSPVVIPRYHAIRIFHNKKCLAVRPSGEIGIDECEYEDTYKRSNQLFIWVDDKLFNKNYNPLTELDPTKNPENPYFRKSQNENRTAWG